MDEELKREQATTQSVTPDATYTDPYGGQLKELYSRITTRKPFEYNADDDAMYQQYRDRYLSLGRDAMRDTMGQAAALTGGYGNSYGQAVGQQVYNSYLQGLNDKGLELYQAAYDRWKDADALDRQNYALLSGLSDDDYRKFRDRLSDARYENETAWSRLMDEQKLKLSADETAWARQMDEKKLALDTSKTSWSQSMDEKKLNLSEADTRAKYGDFDGYAGLYGSDTAKKMSQGWAMQNPELAFSMGILDQQTYAKLALYKQYPALALMGIDPTSGNSGSSALPGFIGGFSGGNSGGDSYDGGNWYKATGTYNETYNPTGELFPGVGGSGVGVKPSDYYGARAAGMTHQQIVDTVNR